jgi:hypothetical protein
MHGAEEPVVAVGRAPGGIGRADRAAGAALVLDQRLLAERLAQLRGDRARESIRTAAGGERIEEDHRLLRPGLRLGERAVSQKYRACCGTQQGADCLVHGWLSC